MSFDPITYTAVQQLKKTVTESTYDYIWSSRTITVPEAAELTIRAMGAGGGGERGNGLEPGAKGGVGGTVALKTLTVFAGDTLNVVIPAGGVGGTAELPEGTSGGTLLVRLNSDEILSIPGGGRATGNPVGADWFVKSTPPTGAGGGSAMLMQGLSTTGTAAGRGGAGVFGNGGTSTGGGMMFDADAGITIGGVELDKNSIILRLIETTRGFMGGTTPRGGDGGAGGFGAGGGGGGGAAGQGVRPGTRGGDGGFGGGGGGGGDGGNGVNNSSYYSGANAGKGGNGGFGGGGGAGGHGGTGYHAESTDGAPEDGGAGGQGWVTLEWRYI